QLQAKLINKSYYALVKGNVQLEETGDIIYPICRPADRIITRFVTKNGKYAHTYYRDVQSWGEIHLVEIQLNTGRTHKIRDHFYNSGY
ncbi:pseudouridine synthase, partial [Streptococcus suis]